MKRKRTVIKFLKKYESSNSCKFENIIIPGFHELNENFSDRKITIIELIEEDNKIIAFWKFNGKEIHPQFELKNFRREVTFRGSHVFYFHFDKIISVISTLNDFIMKDQIKNFTEVGLNEIETFKEYLQTLVALNIN